MKHRIISSNGTLNTVDIKAQLEAALRSSHKTQYLSQISSLFKNISLSHLPAGVQTLWADLPIGFHTHEIAKVAIPNTQSKNLFLVVKAYLFSVDSSPSKQGAIAIVPHAHVGIPSDISDRFHQAVTYALKAEGTGQITENHFERLETNQVRHHHSTHRELGSIGFDSSPNDVHNFEVSGSGKAKAIVLAAYITAKNPDIYFQEQVETLERASQIAGLIEKGFTPYRPTTEFTDPFVLSPSLTTLPQATTTILKQVTLPALQAQVSSRWVEATPTTLPQVQAHIDRLNLGDTAVIGITPSLTPFLNALQSDLISPIIVSWKPETCSCEDSTLFRLNYATKTAGIDLHNELRLNVRGHVSKTGEKSIHVYISRATHEAHGKQMVSSSQYDVGTLGVIKLAVNPLNILDGIQKNTGTLSDTKIIFHIHPHANSEDPVSNNLGHRNLSVTAKGSDYFKVVEDTIRSIDGLDIEIRKYEGDFWTPQERAAAEEAKKAKKK